MKIKSIKSNSVIENKIKNQEYHGAAPRGYKWVVVSGNKRYYKSEMIIDEKQAEIVKFIFETYVEDKYSLDSIAYMIQTKYQIKTSSTHFSNLLNNKFYIGIMKIKGKEYPHKYPLFISKELFNKVQFLLNQNNRKKYIKRNHLFANLLLCGYCKCSIIGTTAKGKYNYYYCSLSREKHDRPYVKEKDLAYMIDQKIKDDVALLGIEKEYYKFVEIISVDKNNTEQQIIYSKVKVLYSVLYLTGDETEENNRHIYGELLPKIKVLWNIEQFTNKQSDIEIPTSIPENYSTFLNFCKEPKNIDAIVEHTSQSLLEVQDILIDMQLMGLIDQNQAGQWVSL